MNQKFNPKGQRNKGSKRGRGFLPNDPQITGQQKLSLLRHQLCRFQIRWTFDSRRILLRKLSPQAIRAGWGYELQPQPGDFRDWPQGRHYMALSPESRSEPARSHVSHFRVSLRLE